MKESDQTLSRLHSAMAHGEEGNMSARKAYKAWESEALFGNAKEVLILHGGEEYHLRITRNNKLILNK